MVAFEAEDASGTNRIHKVVRYKENLLNGKC